jgi:kinesin family protein 20
VFHLTLLAPDLNWIHVRDVEEAWKLLKVGRKNQSFASTHMNQQSSRRSAVGIDS